MANDLEEVCLRAHVEIHCSALAHMLAKFPQTPAGDAQRAQVLIWALLELTDAVEQTDCERPLLRASGQLQRDLALLKATYGL